MKRVINYGRAELNRRSDDRRTTNKIKDIFDTYVKNDKTKNIPIMDMGYDYDKYYKIDGQPDLTGNQDTLETSDDDAVIHGDADKKQ